MEYDGKQEILRQYLLSLEELFPEETSGEPWAGDPAATENSRILLERAFCRVDDRRREKAAAMRPGRARAASLGAGLLLQLALGEMTGVPAAVCGDFAGEELPGKHVPGQEVRRYTFSRLLARLENVPFFPAEYGFGERGKPYFRDYPFRFSLSHSGNYVFCAVSPEDLGSDIQQRRTCRSRTLAERFFSDEEKEALRRAGQERGSEYEQRLFYELWVRKESYGKLTGRGIADAAGVNLLPGRETLRSGRKLLWTEEPDIPGYSLAVCRYDRTQSPPAGGVNKYTPEYGPAAGGNRGNRI